MKKTKSFISLLLAAIMVLSVFSVSASAAVYGDFEYSVDGTNATITKYNGSSTSVTIPSKINGYTVKTIGNSAFKDNSKIKSVSIPSTVTLITPETYYTDQGSFQNCTRLETVTIAEGTEDAIIGYAAFAGCTALTSITIPGNYYTIRKNAFINCKMLSSATLKKSSYSYANQTIGIDAFNNCTSLKTLSLPTTLKTISSGAFYNCDSLVNVKIPEGVTLIENRAFKDCANLKTVSIPSTVTTITSEDYYTDQGSFQNCPKLETVTIAEGTEDAIIGYAAFAGCTALTSITIPGNYYTIRKNAFINCKMLSSVTLKKSSYSYANQTIGIDAFNNCTSLKTLSLPTTLKTISSGAFYNCDSLVNVKIPEGVTLIENRAFKDCASLKTVSIPSTVTTITSETYYGDQGSFQNCPKLETVVIANGGETDASIGNGAFSGNTNLKTIHIPSNYVTIHDGAFTGCVNLTICNSTKNCPAKDYASTHSINFKVCSGHKDEPPKTSISAPTITLTNVASSGKIKISWNNVNGAESYKVYRATSSGGTYKLMKTTSSTSYTNTSATAGKTYYYKVRAVASDGTLSKYSSVKSRTCDLAKPVVTSSNVSSSGKIKLKWDKVEGATSYKVYRATSKSGTYKLMKTTSSTSYTNTSATAGKTYYYKVKAVCSNSAADSAYSSIITRTCDLAKPTNVQFYFNSSNKPVVKWSKVDGATSYKVYRATSQNGTYKLMKTTTSTSYTNTSISHGTTYYYKVKAVCSNSAADSAYSAVVGGYVK